MKYLYHYTKLESLKKILNSNSLWASHLSNNDIEEIISGQKVIDDLIDSTMKSFFKKNNNLNIDQKCEAEKLKKAIKGASGDEFYITSFCGYPYKDTGKDGAINNLVKDNGILSQWRAYSSEEGCAIVFNNDKLEELYKDYLNGFDVSYYIDRVNYKFHNYKKVYKKEFGYIEKCITKFIEDKFLKNTEMSTEEFTAIFKVICLTKHPGFHEENEVRFICLRKLPRMSEDGVLKIKTGEKGQKYLDIRFKSSLINCIEKIIVGPLSEKQENVIKEIEDFLQENSLGQIPIVKSNFPIKNNQVRPLTTHQAFMPLT